MKNEAVNNPWAKPNNSFNRSANSAAFIRQLEWLFRCVRASLIRALCFRPVMRIKKALIILLVLLVGLIVSLPLAFFTYAQTHSSKAVLFRVEDTGDPVGTPFIFILNPYRDRGAEDTAAAFLEKLKAGQCRQVVEKLYASNPEYRQYVCEREGKYHLESWSLADWEEQPSRVRLYFRNKRNVYDAQDGQLWVTVEKQGDQWQVVNYECWY